jgi:ribosomal protein S18 acetylase RimI-like enzyme
MPSNHERLLQLAEDAFAMRSDPAQLQVDEHVLEHLRQLHPATVCEENDANGPIAWVLLIPTMLELMRDFVQGRITEQQLYDRTPMGGPYQAVYLCSGMVLPEHQRKGLATRMTLEALDHMRKDHPIEALFVWTFSEAGLASAKVIAAAAGLSLLERKQRWGAAR